ncbi:MAG: Mov34/MPN/PAD-1 family protein, partial [Planctomycetales bacterium]
FESPDSSRRPDRNRHWAVVAYGRPAEEDLPIFMDMDVLRDCEAHSQEDRSVELGGVLLGGQYEDEDGKPFVVVYDSIRAKHYESSRGHFKFTHDTWSEISREQEGFSEDMRMVGWYHTHPGWGVFLSGMDTFICDHFFNRPLDVALVVDPINLDRGYFYWTRGQGAQRLPQCKGFYLFSKRQRIRELEGYVYHLQGHSGSTVAGFPEAVAGGGDFHAFNEPRGGASAMAPQQNNSWMAVSMMGTLFLQFFLIFLLAWQFGLLPDPPGKKGEDQTTETEEAEKLASARDHESSRLAHESALRIQAELLDRLINKSPEASDRLAQEYAEVQQENGRLRAAQLGFEVLQNEKRILTKQLTDSKDDYKKIKASKEKLNTEAKALRKKRDNLQSALKKQEKKLAELQTKVDATSGVLADLNDEEGELTTWGHYHNYIIYGMGGLLVVGCAFLATIMVRKGDERDAYYDRSYEDRRDPGPRR